MDIIIRNTSGKPIYEQITEQIKGMIMSGALKENDPLPSMRQLARDLRISVITTKRAYDDLERDGFLTTVVGKGTFVATRNIAFIYEEQMKQIEGLLNEALTLAKQTGVSTSELIDLLTVLDKE